MNTWTPETLLGPLIMKKFGKPGTQDPRNAAGSPFQAVMQVGSVPANDLQLGQIVGGAKAGRQDDDVEVVAIALFIQSDRRAPAAQRRGRARRSLAHRGVVGVAGDGALGAERMVRRQFLDEIGASGQRLLRCVAATARSEPVGSGAPLFRPAEHLHSFVSDKLLEELVAVLPWLAVPGLWPAVKALFLFGTTQVGERWKTVTELATFAASATTWTAEAPVPTTPTRLPRGEMSSRQRDVWNAMPGKAAMSMPGGISGC